MRTFDVQIDINKLLDQVGLSDDWIGAVIDSFVIDYVFDRPSVIAETMEELAPPTCKVCGDPYSAHQHYRPGTDCAQCPCPQYRETLTRSHYVMKPLTGLRVRRSG
jgi:hypothetical protein